MIPRTVLFVYGSVKYTFQVWVPEVIEGIEVQGLASIDPVNVQGTSYRAYEGRDFPPGQGLQLEITGLPLPGAWARFTATVKGGHFWQVAIPSALGATLAAMLLWGLIRGYGPAPAAGVNALPIRHRSSIAVR